MPHCLWRPSDWIGCKKNGSHDVEDRLLAELEQQVVIVMKGHHCEKSGSIWKTVDGIHQEPPTMCVCHFFGGGSHANGKSEPKHNILNEELI